MDWGRLLLVLSLAGNVVLAVALFFKSALNEIVIHWYKERVRRQEKRGEILQGLNRHMTLLQRSHFQVMVALGLMHMATTAEDQALANESFEEARGETQETNDFLQQHELEFPQSVRGMIAELQMAVQLPADAARRALSQDEIVRSNNAVTAATERIKAEVVRLVA